VYVVQGISIPDLVNNVILPVKHVQEPDHKLVLTANPITRKKLTCVCVSKGFTLKSQVFVKSAMTTAKTALAQAQSVALRANPL
jgi:hypothetical protein